MGILTIASSKGGPGKTTVSMLLAGQLAHEGLKVAAVDADPAQAFMRWATRTYEGVPLFAAEAEADEARLAHLIHSLRQTADVVLVDTAGFGNRAATVAMTSADAVLIPAVFGAADVIEAENTVRLVAGLSQAARRVIPAGVLLNRLKRTQIARHVIREIESADLPMLTSALGDLVAYAEMSFSGRAPNQGVAGAEIARLVAELRELGWIGRLHDVTQARGNANEGTAENVGSIHTVTG
jgi:chromosome partitioning protein